MVFKSKISKGLLILLLVAILLAPAIMLYHHTHVWEAIILLLLTSAICLPSLLNTRYTIEENTLKIRSGIFYKKDLAIDSIRKIVETNNMISSPAASLDRLELFYNSFDSVLISPKDKAGFIRTIQAINPEVEVIYKS
ncbi:PH domain-containing protein [Sphingobacterium yanglingense]|uniref:PH (Pleckstrin Homology) domain-containing protein n=1 Tax=Sphingobacterium yanglingense TaxID=1437280 RepID=A0A4R6WJE8_9SPHI|nr:PH domain-containing protein [Sphingobacterium yanglingense]TDQ78094.1 PH (Pleckstrin Homology) domain-containing protein [Sphingobacterium yanglingense]